MSESIFDTDEFKHLQKPWSTRQKVFTTRRDYYTGDVYKKLRQKLGFLAPRLYRGIKPLYLPLARAVDVDAGIVPGGWAWAEDANEAWMFARKQVFNWSKWSTEGVLYVHFGAQYGNVGLKVADLQDVKQVIIQPLDPCRFILTHNSAYTDQPNQVLLVEQRRGSDGKLFEYAEAIDADTIRTFRDGQPAGFDDRDAEYPNALGFVPVVEIEHMKTGAAFGDSTFEKAIPMLDEVNQLASYLGDIIAKHAEAQWAVIGAEPSDLVKSGDNVWFIPGGGDAKALVAPIDIAGVLAFIQEIAGNVKNALPELSFDELREKTQIATATLELQLMELVLKVKRVRPNYDAGLVAALRMAGKAAGTMNLADIRVLDNEMLTFDDERPVLPLDPATAMELEMQSIALERERAMEVGEGA